MNNKLPSVFVNKQIKKVGNNKEYYYFKNQETPKSDDETKKINDLFVQKKINDIFASPSFIYKVYVLILTDKGESRETIIARNHDSLITIKNEKILIDNIHDIKILN